MAAEEAALRAPSAFKNARVVSEGKIAIYLSCAGALGLCRQSDSALSSANLLFDLSQCFWKA